MEHPYGKQYSQEGNPRAYMTMRDYRDLPYQWQQPVERRLRAADHVQAYQRKMTCAFRKRVRPRKFQKGDLVLKVLRGLTNDPRGKFRPNWSGPYVIRDLTQEGAAWLTDLDGNQFTEPVNVDQLKRFYA